MSRVSMVESVESWSLGEEEGRRATYKKNQRRAFSWMALGLEIIGEIMVIIVAIYLRVEQIHPNVRSLNWRKICEDLTLSETHLTEDYSLPLYLIIIIIPIIFIAIVELENTLFSKHSFFENLNKKQRIRKSIPRWTRILALFILGLFLASFFADYLKLIVIKPRPYFLTDYGSNCPKAYNGTITDEFYYSLQSFPSHLASVSGFCCLFAVSYAHVLRPPHSGSLLVPIMSQGFLVIAVTVSMDRYTSNYNHIVDIVAGLVIGSLLAFYMSTLVIFQERVSEKRNTEDGPYWNVWDWLIPRARVSLPPTIAEARTRAFNAHRVDI